MQWSRRAVLVALLAGACAGPEGRPGGAPTAGPSVVSPERALALAVAGEAVLVDVRLPQERVDRREPPHTAAWFPFDRYTPRQFSTAVSETVDGQRSRPVVLICEVGVRSGWAAHALTEAGFTDVMTVDRGYALWRDQALALVDGRDMPTPDLSLD
ncbi:rhodanese-like domain-containing protein [Elioraea sp.]|uniref:rhodanese-like domain-containing protein n=1 Tax=Elioraea sp. TaxID=2185103 RepID=UPI0025BF30EF|nr:rhodanese-like domain-containing protein [Elioraea sp.]